MALEFSGMQSRSAGTHSASTLARNSAIRRRHSSGWFMSLRMTSSFSWHSTSRCPWNMVLTSGSAPPGRNGSQSKRNPMRSWKWLMWWLGATVSLDASGPSTLSHVVSSSLVRGCSPNASTMRGWGMRFSRGGEGVL